jgi:cholesterol transport system auxiliary component
MNSSPFRIYSTLLPIVLLLCLAAGCSLKQPHAEKHTFALEATRTAAARALSLPVQVQVRPTTITPPFDNRAFTYRTSDLGYKNDFYNGFVSPPNILLTAQLQSWLGAAKLFQSVLPATSALPITHTLETQVLTLHGDFRNPSAPKAILEVRFLLLDQRRARPSLVFDKSYREEIPFADPQANALAGAWSQALGKIFTTLETDLGTTAIH